MGFGIRSFIDDKTAILEIRAYLGIPFGSMLELEPQDYITTKVRSIILNNLNNVFDDFPGIAGKFIHGTPNIKLFSDKERDTLYFVLNGYRVYRTEGLDEFISFFCNIIIEEVCRRSVFDITFGVDRFKPVDPPKKSLAGQKEVYKEEI